MSCFISATLCVGAWNIFSHDAEAQTPFERIRTEKDYTAHIYLGWDSRYISEGRDNLAGDSLGITSAELTVKHIAAGVWYARSPENPYDEAQVSLAAIKSLGIFDLYLSWTHIRYDSLQEFDNEVGAGFTLAKLPFELEFTLDTYYSWKAEGLFLEAGLRRPWKIFSFLQFTPSLHAGANAGYIRDGHRGPDHLTGRAEIEYLIAEMFSVIAHGSYSQTLGFDQNLAGDKSLKNLAYVGIGFLWKI